MNIQEYISSGILESYVLGAATPEERKEVEKLAAIHPEIKLELEEIETAMNSYVTEHSIEPPAYLKGKILSQIAVESTDGSVKQEHEIKVLTQTSSSFSYWSIAASILFLISAGFAIYFGVKSSKLDDSLATISKTNNVLSDSIKSIASSYNQMESDMAILKNPTYKMVELKGLKVAPDSKAMVCWSATDKKVYIEIEKLPEPPQGMQYQFWAIVDGKPIDEGMLAMGSGLHRMKDVDNAQAFAVTLEKQGGSPTPHGDMYVMGTINTFGKSW